MELDRCNGPECPACGCTDTRILQRPASPEPGKASWWASGRARCNYCGNRFAFRELPGPADRHADTATDHDTGPGTALASRYFPPPGGESVKR